MAVKKQPKNIVAGAVINSLEQYNSTFGKQWSLGASWTNVGTEFETYVMDFLFPKLNETTLIQKDLGNRYDFLAEEKEFIGQLDEEYVFKDTIPINLNLSKAERSLLKRNYPKIMSKLYSGMYVKKQKFTLNNNDVRQNFATLADAVKYALGIYKKIISDLNYSEELEMKSMLVDYTQHVQDKRHVDSLDQMCSDIIEGILNLQNNSHRHNEYKLASNGHIGRYTTTTKLEDVAILTTDKIKAYILNENNANKFNIDGVDISKRVMSFEDLGGTYVLTEDVTIENIETIVLMREFGNYETEKGDLIEEGSMFSYDVSELKDFIGKLREIKPETPDLFAYVHDINKIRYKRNTKNMIKQPFYNQDSDEYNHMIMLPQSKNISPFYNSILFTGEEV